VHLDQLQAQQSQAINVRFEELETKRARMAAKHGAERERLRAAQQESWEAETKARQAR